MPLPGRRARHQGDKCTAGNAAGSSPMKFTAICTFIKSTFSAAVRVTVGYIVPANDFGEAGGIAQLLFP